MLRLILNFGSLFTQYIYFYLILFLMGRSFLLIIFKIFFRSKTLSDEILFTKSTVFYPLLGYFFIGNIVMIINFLLPIKNFFALIIILLFLIINIFNIKKPKLNFNKDFFIKFIFIPAVLLISSYDASFHYDSGFYHLNHQNWIRESNIVIGMVNIFWPFGIASINEYVSATFWTNSSLIYLHFIQLLFIHIFYNFLYTHIFQESNSAFKYPSLFILVFSLLDNFGFQGGRNGFIYIQEIGMQDTQVSVLVIISTLLISRLSFEKQINYANLILISIFSILVFQIKIGSVYIILFYIISIMQLMLKRKINFYKLITLNIPALFFLLVWFAKNYLISGCFIFPVNFTCVNKFDWYRLNSTKRIELYTSNTSFGYKNIFSDNNKSFQIWFEEFFNNNMYSNFYSSFYLNFLVSFFILLLLKKLFTNKNFLNENTRFLNIAYVVFSITFLLFFGPIPRYTSGVLTATIGLIGLNIKSLKFSIYNYLILAIFISSIISLPRLNSYIMFYENRVVTLSDPRYHIDDLVQLDENWTTPLGSDQCWVNLNCTSELGGKIILVERNFKTIYRELDK